MSKVHTCRNCVHYDLEGSIFNGRVFKDAVSECLYPSGKIILPDSVIKYIGKPSNLHKTFMSPGEGENCATWEDGRK